MSKVNRRYLIGLAYFSLFAYGLLDNIRGPFLPEVNYDLALTGTTSSMYYSFTSLLAFIGSLISPIFLRRHSSVKLLMWSSLLLGFAFAALSQSHTLTILLLSASAVGLTFGALNLSQNVLVGEASTAKMRRRLYSGLHSMYGLSALTAPISASGFRWLGLDWRQSFLILAILPVVIGLFAVPQRNSVHTTGEPQNPKLTGAEFKAALLMALVMACYLFGEISASSRMVLWLRSERGFSPDQANLYLAGFCVLLLAGRMLFTFVHFSWHSEVVLRVSALFSALFYALGLIHSPLWMVLSGATMAPFFPVAMDYVNEQFGSRSSAALSLILGLGSLSVVVMHTSIGLISDWRDLTHALGVGPLGLALILVLFWPWLFSSQRVTKK